MSRVLKFRIWDKANKEYMILGATGLDARNGDVIDYYNEGDRLGGPEEYDIEQYTGLADKNGKEIYEGDIVFCDQCDENHAIEWSDNAARFDSWDSDGIRCIWFGESQEEINYTIIGNIHENKELWNDSEK